MLVDNFTKIVLITPSPTHLHVEFTMSSSGLLLQTHGDRDAAAGAITAAVGITGAVGGAVSMAVRQAVVVFAAVSLGVVLMAAVVWYAIYKTGLSEVVLKKTGADKILNTLPPGVRESMGNAAAGITEPGGEKPAAPGVGELVSTRSRRWWKFGRG
jgi:hypothetical protein